MPDTSLRYSSKFSNMVRLNLLIQQKTLKQKGNIRFNSGSGFKEFWFPNAKLDELCDRF